MQETQVLLKISQNYNLEKSKVFFYNTVSLGIRFFRKDWRNNHGRAFHVDFRSESLTPHRHDRVRSNGLPSLRYWATFDTLQPRAKSLESLYSVCLIKWEVDLGGQLWAGRSEFEQSNVRNFDTFSFNVFEYSILWFTIYTGEEISRISFVVHSSK